MKIILAICGIIAFSFSFAQEIKFLDGKEPEKAHINDISWLEGHWIGEMGNSTIEEVWTNQALGQMMGMFRMYNNEISVYEFMTVSVLNESLVLKIKHFNKQMVAWEEKEEFEEFKLVNISDSTAYFDAFTFAVSNDTLSIHLFFDREGEKKNKGLFKYARKE